MSGGKTLKNIFVQYARMREAALVAHQKKTQPAIGISIVKCPL